MKGLNKISSSHSPNKFQKLLCFMASKAINCKTSIWNDIFYIDIPLFLRIPYKNQIH